MNVWFGEAGCIYHDCGVCGGCAPLILCGLVQNFGVWDCVAVVYIRGGIYEAPNKGLKYRWTGLISGLMLHIC
jgi:hypothetical protein